MRQVPSTFGENMEFLRFLGSWQEVRDHIWYRWTPAWESDRKALYASHPPVVRRRAGR